MFNLVSSLHLFTYAADWWEEHGGSSTNLNRMETELEVYPISLCCVIIEWTLYDCGLVSWLDVAVFGGSGAGEKREGDAHNGPL